MKLEISGFKIQNFYKDNEFECGEYQYYRDMGGKKTGVQFTVLLKDDNGRVVFVEDYGAPIELNVTCLYEDGSKPSSDEVIEIDGRVSVRYISSTAAVFRIRFNEISKNHKNRKFILRVHCPDRRDILSADTMGIEVLTKFKVDDGSGKRKTLPESPEQHGKKQKREIMASPKKLRQGSDMAGDRIDHRENRLLLCGLESYRNNILMEVRHSLLQRKGLNVEEREIYTQEMNEKLNRITEVLMLENKLASS